MGRIYNNFKELVGNTPLMNISSFSRANGAEAKILAKLEFFNPAGSVKDRVGINMIDDAVSKGILKKGGVIIEPTSGNTGIGIAAYATSMGFKAIIVMPETMSLERRKLIKAYGAEIVLTEGAKGMAGAIEKAEELHKEIEGSIIAGQFENPANPETHYKTTGPEIWEDTEGKVDIFVAGVGTGGTLSGVGKFLKEKNPNVKIVAVEPYNSAVLSGEKAGVHGLQGIGAGFIPKALDTEIYDEVVKIKNEEAFEMTKSLVKTEGLLTGISSGAALAAALKLSKREENKGKVIVALIPDTGERYLSTEGFID